jgi:hypothetical protein
MLLTALTVKMVDEAVEKASVAMTHKDFHVVYDIVKADNAVETVQRTLSDLEEALDQRTDIVQARK